MLARVRGWSCARVRSCALGEWMGERRGGRGAQPQGRRGQDVADEGPRFALAERGVRVLQVGLDPQSSLEVLAGLGFDTPPERTVSRLLMPEEFGDAARAGARSCTRRRGGRGWCRPARRWPAPSARSASPAAAARASGSSAAWSASTSTSALTLVLIDCPPGMTPLTMNALVAADSVLVPTQLDFLSVAGLAVLTETVEEVREYDNPGLRYLGIVGTQADERTRHAREIRAQLEQLFGAQRRRRAVPDHDPAQHQGPRRARRRPGRRPARPGAPGQRRLPRARRRARRPRPA